VFFKNFNVRLQKMYNTLDMGFSCHPEGRCGLSSSRSLEELIAIVNMCERKYGL